MIGIQIQQKLLSINVSSKTETINSIPSDRSRKGLLLMYDVSLPSIDNLKSFLQDLMIV